ncbi:MAG: NAD(P)H-dependent oxidoreductase [Fastidiosipilaceae bacterium]
MPNPVKNPKRMQLRSAQDRLLRVSTLMVINSPGMRIIKTTLSILTCLMISYFFGNPDMYTASIAAVVCLQNDLRSTWQSALNRSTGTLIAGFYSYLFLLITVHTFHLSPDGFFYYILVGVFSLPIMQLLVRMNKPGSVAIGVIVYVIICVTSGMQAPLEYTVDRMADTLLGIAVAVFVNWFPLLNLLGKKLKQVQLHAADRALIIEKEYLTSYGPTVRDSRKISGKKKRSFDPVDEMMRSLAINRLNDEHEIRRRFEKRQSKQNRGQSSHSERESDNQFNQTKDKGVNQMRKRILILTGSGRKNGNSDTMAQQFAEGARSAGHEVTFYDTVRRPIKPCISCNNCFKDGIPCMHDDGFTALANQLSRTDVLVLSTPIYWYSFPAALKAAIDKLYAFVIGNQDLPITSAALMVCGEQEDKAIYDPMLKTYELILKDCKWEDQGQIVITNVLREVDLDKRPGLMSQLYKFGASIK